jgi:hypothetical protein
MWAEWYRYLAEDHSLPDAFLPRDVHACEIQLTVADLSTDERLAAVGLPKPIPTQSQWPDFQRIGERLFLEGWAGILYVCAARTDSRSLCVFRVGTGSILAGVGPCSFVKRQEAAPVPPTGMTT